MIRRILDYFGLASYRSHPRILRRPDLAIGVNVHADGSNFAEVKAAGFDTVRMDAPPESPIQELTALFISAKAHGLKIALSGLKGWNPDRVFLMWGDLLDFVSPANEPDQLKWRPGDGTISGLADWIVRCSLARDKYAPHVRLIVPTVSGLSRDLPKRFGSDELIRELGRFKTPEIMRSGDPMHSSDLIGHHLYERTPDAVLREFKRVRKVYRSAGWPQKFFISETGWEAEEEYSQLTFRHPSGALVDIMPERFQPQEKQALYVANTMAMLAKEPEIAGIGVYCLNDDVAARDFFGIRGKKAWTRISEALKP